jgi:hypothetical protein
MNNSIILLAQQTTTNQTTTITLPSEIGNKLDTIRIPTFLNFSSFVGSSATIFSFLAFFGTLATIGIAIFWIYKIIRLGIEGIQSEGKQEKIQELIKKLQRIFLGIFMSFLFPVILSIIGIFAGIGNIFQWPKMFQSCNSPTYQYYFQAFLAQEGVNSTDLADRECNIGPQNSNTIEEN